MAPANRMPMSDTRKFALAALIVVGVFLVFCGAGMSSLAVGSIGVVLAVGGPILIFATTLRGNVRSYVFGTARVVEISPPPTVGPSGRGELGLVIHARGIDGVAVRVRDPAIPLNKWPQVGATLPVRSVSGSPRKTIVLWADVRTHEEATYDDRINPEYADLSDEERGPNAAGDDEFDHGPLPPDDTPTMTDIPPAPTSAPPSSDGGSAERVASVAVAERRRRPSPHPRKPVHDEAVAVAAEPMAEPQDVVAEPQDVVAESQDEVLTVEPEEVVAEPVDREDLEDREDQQDQEVEPAAPAPKAVEFEIAPLPVRTATELPVADEQAEPEPEAEPEAVVEPETTVEPEPQTPEPQTPEPQTPEPQTPELQTPEPQTPEPQTPEPETAAEPEAETAAEPEAEQEPEPEAAQQATPDNEQADTTTAAEDPHDAALAALLAPLEPLAAGPPTAASVMPTQASVIGPGDVEREIIAPNPYATEQYVPAAETHPAAPRHRAPEPIDAREQEGETDPADVLEEEPTLGAVAEFLPATPQRRPVPLEGVNGVSVTLIVSDLQRSLRFYRETLGLSEVDSNGSSAVLASGDARVVLRRSADMPPVDRRVVHLNLEVPDVYEAYERLKAEGVEFVHRPRVVPQGEQLDLCTATFRDPDGHAISLTRWELRR